MKNNFKFLVGAAVALSLFAVTSMSAAYMHTGLLKMGSKGTQVMELQKALNSNGFLVSTVGAGSPGMETSTFAPKTKAAVMAFQSAKGLTSDGIVGAQTGTALAASTGGSVTYPAGCSSTTGFSTTTGKPCTSTANFPAGCTSAAGYSTTTGTKCDSTTGGSTNTGGLTGGAGSINATATSTDVESDVEEGTTEKVLGTEIEADGSDVAITNVKVTLKSTAGPGSSRIEKYFDEVSIWLGDKKVGSVDADEFSKNGTEYSKSIALTGAVISEDDEANLYVGLTALSTVDEDTQKFSVTLDNVRYTDATGAILMDIHTQTVTNVGFDVQGVDDELSVKTSAANPVASTLKVETNSKSDDYAILALDFKADKDSSDLDVLTLPITLTITPVAAGLTENFDTVVNDVYVKVGSKKYTADRVALGTDITGIYSVDFKDGFTIDSGDTEEVKVYVVFNKQSGNYDAGTTISAAVTATTIEVEGSDELNGASQLKGGTSTGKTHTLQTAAPMITLKSKSFELVQQIDGVVPGAEDIFEAKFVFTVSSDEDTVFLPLMSGVVSNTTVGFTATGGATIQGIVINANDNSIKETNSYRISDEEEFTLTFTLRGNDAVNAININTIGLSNDDNTTIEVPVTGGLNMFQTVSKYLAK